MKNNEYVEVRLNAWKTKIEVMEVKITGVSDENYCEVLTKLFNNKRENKSILELNNYYQSNDIELLINLNAYREHSYDSKDDNIKHLVDWVKYVCNYEAEVTYEIKPGYLYQIDEYKSKIEWFDENEKFQYNFIRGDE